MKIAALFFSILCLSMQGCTTFPASMSGQYIAENGQFVVVDSGGDIYWSPLSKTRNDLIFVGTVGEQEWSEEDLYLRISSNSRFFATTVRYSKDNKKMTINWSKHSVDSEPDRATEYSKVEPSK